VLQNTATPSPQIWFRDLAGSWFYVAENFTDYFRIMVMHLGLPGWQYAFTDVGLDPVCQQWFRFFSPERLDVDLQTFRKKRGETTGNQSTSGGSGGGGGGGGSGGGSSGGGGGGGGGTGSGSGSISGTGSASKPLAVR
jgi:hypothetical protein